MTGCGPLTVLKEFDFAIVPFWPGKAFCQALVGVSGSSFLFLIGTCCAGFSLYHTFSLHVAHLVRPVL